MNIICDELNQSDHRDFDPSKAYLKIDLALPNILENAQICEDTKWSGEVCHRVAISKMIASAMGEPYFPYVIVRTSIGDFNISVDDAIKVGVRFPVLMNPFLMSLFNRRNRNWKESFK